MSEGGGLQISSGGAIAVDTDSLRHAAERLHGEARRMQDLTGELRRQCATLEHAAGPWASTLLPSTSTLDVTAGVLADEADSLGGRLSHAASVYEIVEQRVAQEQATARGDDNAARLAQTRIDLLAASDPELVEEADAAEKAFHDQQTARMAHIATSFLPLRGMVGWPWTLTNATVAGVGVSVLISEAGLGRMYPGTTGKDPGPVTVRQVGAMTTAAPPRTLADMVRRVPTGATSSAVRVERYTMRDGTQRYTAYIRGTQDWGLGGREPNNMTSNLELYQHEASRSSKAAVRALTLAGARPGDTVDLVGHSQGGMVAGRVALDGGYRTGLLVTVGSPTEAQVRGGVMSVQLRHTDDVVAQLAGGGSSAHVGSPDSVVITREADPATGMRHEAHLPAHALTAYEETARQADENGGAQIVPVHREIGRLQDAVSVEVFEFDTETPPPAPAPVPDMSLYRPPDGVDVR